KVTSSYRRGTSLWCPPAVAESASIGEDFRFYFCFVRYVQMLS
ncbi:unnamed protein product, partial [Brassica oleracea var. botrytis]